MLKRQLVLVAVDHATDLKRAIAVARGVAKARGGDIDVIQAVPHTAVPFDDHPRVQPTATNDRSVTTRITAILRRGDRDGVHVRSVTLRGRPERVIPAYSQIHQATLLVVQRDYGSSRLWRHSRVVDDLARRSPIPLLVLPTREEPERDLFRLRRVVTAVDSSIASAVALRTAVDLSRDYGARLSLVHALKDVPRQIVFSGSEAWELARRLPARLDAAAVRLRRKAALLGAPDVDTEVATGDAGRTILEMTARRGADLIVMGIAHRSWVDRVMLGSTLRRVLRRATVPILVVPVVAGADTWPDEHGVDQVGSSGWAAGSVERFAA